VTTSFISTGKCNGNQFQWNNPTSIKCKTSANISCVRRDTGETCADNMNVNATDCSPTNIENSIVPVEITYMYCNNGNQPQISYSDKSIAKFKNKPIGIPDKNEPLPAKKCNTWKVQKDVNPCTGGAATSIQYEGYVLGREDSYCYAYKHINVPKKKVAPAITIETDITCTLKNEGVPCEGNIVKTHDGKCKKIEVTYDFQACYSHDNMQDDEFVNYNPNLTWAKLEKTDVDSNDMDLTPLTKANPCNTILTRDININTCVEKTVATMKVALNMYGTPRGNYMSVLRVYPTALPPTEQPSSHPSIGFDGGRVRLPPQTQTPIRVRVRDTPDTGNDNGRNPNRSSKTSKSKGQNGNGKGNKAKADKGNGKGKGK